MHYVSKSLFKTLLPLLSTIAVLVACGGGGGGGDAAPAPSASTPVAVTPTPTPTPVTPTPRPLDQPDFELRPNTGTVKVGESLVLDLVDCSVVIAGARKCRKNGEDLVLVEGVASNWAVNGIVGGNSTVGTIVGTNVGATYKAPASKPAPASVSVSAKVAGDITFPLLIVVANLTIVDTAAYRGTISYDLKLPATGPLAKGVANIAWTTAGGLPDVSYYEPSGTMTGVFYLLPACDPLTATIPIAPNIRNSSRLNVFNTLAATPNTLNFTIGGDKNTILTFTCTDPATGRRSQVPAPANNFSMSVGSICTGSGDVPFTDEAHLTGTDVCSLTGTVTWDFLKQ